ncbi:MAG: SCP2 sterol-binding domain-containing protein, partial [Deltaproteobacteria bacterium]|nr:SCP2 sterol-binding domain-containing protein [Deltaproteobacteria bacterium]
RQKVPSIVLLSVCGFPEESEFDALSEFVNRTRHKDVKIVAEIYRPAAEVMTNTFLEDIKNDILDATKLAGRELVQAMRISPETMARIRQPLIDAQTFADLGNIYWKTCISEGVTPKEFKEKELVPRPDSTESFMLLFPFGINSEAVGERKINLQFNFSGEVTDSCYFIIENGHVDAKNGIVQSPDVTIETPFDIWIDIMTGKAEGQQMFMEQKYKVEGDLSLMIQLFQKNVS